MTHNETLAVGTPVPSLNINPELVAAVSTMIRPMTVMIVIAIGALFLLALGAIMLFRYATQGEIDWQGMAGFVTMVLFPTAQWFSSRHNLRMVGRL